MRANRSNQTTTVLLVDAPRAVREALKARLSLEPALAIVGEASDATETLMLAQALGPDVVLVDAEADDVDAVAVARALDALDTPVHIVVLTQHPVTVTQRLDALPAVVVGKHGGLGALVRAIHGVDSASQRP